MAAARRGDADDAADANQVVALLEKGRADVGGILDSLPGTEILERAPAIERLFSIFTAGAQCEVALKAAQNRPAAQVAVVVDQYRAVAAAFAAKLAAMPRVDQVLPTLAILDAAEVTDGGNPARMRKRMRANADRLVAELEQAKAALLLEVAATPPSTV